MKNTHLLLINILLMALAAAFTGCAGASDEPDIPSQPSEAKESMAFVASRADGENNQIEGHSFMAWGNVTYRDPYTGQLATQLIFDRYRVDFDENIRWFYNGLLSQNSTQKQYLQYWNIDADHYNFDAVYPYSEEQNINYNDYIPRLPGIKANTQDATDWMVARQCRYLNNTAVNKLCDEDLLESIYANKRTYIDVDRYYDRVQLCFHHILSMIDFRAYKADGTPVVISSVSLKLAGGASLYTQGDYSSATHSWSNLTTSSIVIANVSDIDVRISGWDVNTVTDPKEIATAFFTQLEIPQAMAGRELQISIKTSDFRNYSGTFTLLYDWKPEDRHVYYLEIPDDNREIILVDAVIESFKHAGTIDIEDPVVNW